MIKYLAAALLLFSTAPGYAFHGMGPGPGVKSYSGGDGAPTLSTVAVNATDYTFTYSESVTADTTGELCSDYSVTWTTAGADTLSYASGDGTATVHCTGTAGVGYGDTVSSGMDYTPGSIVDTDGSPNALASISGKAVTNNTTTECSAGCDAVADADLYCEDTDGNGNTCTWTNVGNINWDSTAGLSALACPTKGDSVLEVTMVAAGDHYTYHSETGQGEVHRVFYLRISSTDVDTDGESQMIATFGDAGAASITGIVLYYDTDHLELRHGIDGEVQDATTTISLNTWYKISPYYDAGVVSGFKINGTTEVEDTSITEADNAINFIFGAASVSQSTTFQVAIDKADTTAEPGICGE